MPALNAAAEAGDRVVYSPSVARVLTVLAAGPVADAHGLAIRRFMDRAGVAECSTGSQSQVLLRLEQAGLVRREMRVKRCYRIELAVPLDELPEPYASWVVRYQATSDTAPVLSIVEPEPEPEPTPALSAEDVAAALLDALVARMAEPTPAELRVRLATTLEENQRLRRRLDAAEETCRGQRENIAGLHRQLNEARARLDTLASNDHERVRISEATRRGLTQLMAAPTPLA